MNQFDRKRISDDELRKLAKVAISENMSMTNFQYNLSAKNIAIGRPRLVRIWTDIGGPIQENKRWF